MLELWLIFSDILTSIYETGCLIKVFPNVNLWVFLFSLVVIYALLSSFLTFVKRSKSDD